MKKYEKIIAPLLAILLGILIGTILLVFSGKSPIYMFSTLIKSVIGYDILKPGPINLRYFGEFLVFSMPIILTGLSVGFAYRTGLFNIGGEGQVLVGSAASTAAALLLPMSGVPHLIACLLAGALAGAIWAFIPGILQVKKNINVVVTAIMLNYVGLHFSNWVVQQMPTFAKAKTDYFPVSLKSPFLASITNNSRLHWGIIVVLVALVIYHVLIEKTSFGYSLRATGFNREGARYAGMKVDRNVVYAMMISGAMAGLAGAIITLGTFGYGRQLGASEGYGFDGIAVALVGGCNSIGIFLAGLLFGALKVAQPAMQALQIPKDIATIISACIILFVSMQYGIMDVVYKVVGRFKKKDEVVTKDGGEA
ncbi:MAG: ABC transporter permease [Erysipelotrichales bacterium]|nr:ABC transporter permease [Erysipelotrichales bacterium]